MRPPIDLPVIILTLGRYGGREAEFKGIMIASVAGVLTPGGAS